MNLPDKPFHLILSLAGGGFRGLFTIEFLRLLEDEYGPLKDKVRLYAGTSVGAIIALALARGKPAREVRDAMLSMGSDVFPPETIPFAGAYKKTFTPGSRDPSKLRKAIHDIVGDIELGQLQTPALATAVELTSARAFSE